MFDKPQIPSIKNRGNVLRDATIREFGGGWNVVDNDLNLSTRFATITDNMSREEDGSMAVRWGTELLTSIYDVDWIDPNDVTNVPADSGTAEATRDGSGVGINNPNAFYDENTSQTAAQSTYTHIVGTGQAGTATLVLTVTYNTPQDLNIAYADAPTDGWAPGAASTTAITFKGEAQIDGEWIELAERMYSVDSAPARLLFVSDALQSASVSSLRLTITLSTSANIDTLLACAEVDGATYTGTGQFPADVYIVNIYYFQDSLVVNLSNGAMLRVLGDGTATIIWSDAIAGSLAGTPDGWGETDFVSYAVFNGKLIVCNGTDKPLIIDFNNDPPVQYLADEATGSNANVPICRYVVAMNRYLVMAGDPQFPDRVHISGQDTAGTWYGDLDTDATYVDLGKVGVQGEQIITGINRYRDQLVVGFYSASVLGKLGTYTADTPPVHNPDFNDVIEGFGCHSHRSMVNLGNDLFILDDPGVTSISRSLYSGSTEPKRVSELIDPEINNNVSRLRDADTVLGAHAVYNGNDKQYMLFVPNHAEYARNMIDNPFEVLPNAPSTLWVRIPAHGMLVGDYFTVDGAESWNEVDADAVLNGVNLRVTRVIDDNIIQIDIDGLSTNRFEQLVGGGINVMWTPKWTETLGYVYTFVNELKIRAWARYRGWRWRASCRTELGTVVFADDTQIFLLGNQNRPLHKDFIGTVDEKPITFAWELPWADFDQRVNVKHTRYVQLDTKGRANFTMMLFVDNLYKMEGMLIPNNTLTFVGGGSGGYGNGIQNYGGGRNTHDQRLYALPARGKLFKLRFDGYTDKALRIVAVSLLYQNGSIRR